MAKFPKRPLSKGQSIFINGGSGGVGFFAVQIARIIVGESGKVVASCSSRNIDLVKRLGADDVIDYTSVNLLTYLKEHYASDRFDMVLDNVGSFNLYNACPAFLKEKGDFMALALETPSKERGTLSVVGNVLAGLFLPSWLGGIPRRLIMRIMNATAEDMNTIGGMVERKELKSVVDSVWKFDDEGIKGAYEKLMGGHAAGKVVVKIHD